MAEDLIGSVNDWLNTQGYPLEMRVAAVFQAAGFSVVQSTYFADPETGSSRELDVRAWRAVRVSALVDSRRVSRLVVCSFEIQCKASPAPWIALRPLDDGLIGLPGIWNFGTTTVPMNDRFRGMIDEALTDTSSLLLCPRDQFAYGVVTMKKGDKPDTAFEAVLTAAKSATARCAVATHRPTVSIPVAVTGGKLLTCRLNGGALVTEEVNECAVGLGYPLGDRAGSLVRVVSVDGLENFARSARSLVDVIQDRLSTSECLWMLLNAEQDAEGPDGPHGDVDPMF